MKYDNTGGHEGLELFPIRTHQDVNVRHLRRYNELTKTLLPVCLNRVGNAVGFVE